MIIITHWFQSPVVFSKSFDNPCLLLRYKVDHGVSELEERPTRMQFDHSNFLKEQ